MDERAPYVALSRATALEKLYMVEPITLDQLRHKPKADIAATLDFLDRLDKATQTAFFDKPSEFTPVTVNSVGNVCGHQNGGDPPSGHERPGTDSGSGAAEDGRPEASSARTALPRQRPFFSRPTPATTAFSTRLSPAPLLRTTVNLYCVRNHPPRRQRCSSLPSVTSVTTCTAPSCPQRFW